MHIEEAVMSRYLRVTSTAIVFAALVLSLPGFAQDAAKTDGPQPKRSILDRHDQSGVPGKEIVIGTAELPAGTVIGWHTHDGDESGYVLKGDLVLKTQGKPDQVLKAGDHFFNPRGAVHSLAAAPGSQGGTAVSTWIIDKGKPIAEPVKLP
jgi:quercetin dioxygenase-like cupin family protein